MMTAADLPSLDFRRNADPALKLAAQQNDRKSFQRHFLAQLRRTRSRLEKRLRPDISAVCWSADSLVDSSADRELADQLLAGKKLRRSLDQALGDVNRGPECGPFSILLALEALVLRGSRLKPAVFADLYLSLAGVAVDGVPPAESEEAPGRFRELICCGEIPWVLSLIFRDLKGQSSRRAAAAKVLRDTLESATDTDGMIHADLLPKLDQWLAPFVRSTVWGTAFGKAWVNDPALLKGCVRYTAGLVVPGGLLTIPAPPDGVTEQSSADVVSDLLNHASATVRLRPSSPESLLIRSLNGKQRGRSHRSSRRHRRTSPSCQSDWAASALLRSGLSIDADAFSLAWPDGDVRIQGAVLGTPLLSGSWTSRVSIHGDEVNGTAAWECSCWFVDREAAFIELEADPVDGVHTIRQMMLSLQNRLAIICETVTCTDTEAGVELTSRLPLAGDPLAVTNSITRDTVFHSDCVSTRIIPAWLADDRLQHATGRCDREDDTLVSSARGTGGATIALVLDWHPERKAHDADWARLTVTENRALSSDHHAAGFRVRIGSEQLLIYRSLQPPATGRAVLGFHTMNESVYGRVKKCGEVAPIVLVEGPDE